MCDWATMGSTKVGTPSTTVGASVDRATRIRARRSVWTSTWSSVLSGTKLMAARVMQRAAQPWALPTSEVGPPWLVDTPARTSTSSGVAGGATGGTASSSTGGRTG